MNRRPKSLKIIGPLQVIEEAFHLLRLTPPATLLAYLAGTLPFIAGLLYFWSDMSRSAFAHQRLAGGALIMALLFFWMKTWQAVFASTLLSRLCGEPPTPWTLLRWTQTALRQSIVHSVGLLIFPLSLMTMVFFGWAYAYLQSLSALDQSGNGSTRDLTRQAARQARLWPAQNHAMLLAIKAFALFVFLNLFSAFLAVPFLMKTLLGIDTAFSRAMSEPLTLLPLIFNSTFLACLFALSYVCLDPLMKTIYVLRCFYGESLKSGQDLKAELRQLLPATPAPTLTASRPPPRARAVAGLLLAALICLPSPNPPAHAAPGLPRQPSSAPPTVQPPELNEAVDDVLSRREYAWRMPREEISETTRDPGVIGAFFDGIGDALKNVARTFQGWVKRIGDWFDQLGKREDKTGGGGTGWHSAVKGLLFLLAAGILGLIAWLLFRLWKRRSLRPETVVAHSIPTTPDLEEEHVDAEQLPEDGWLQLARELLAGGQLRLALRAFYLASLAHLAQRNLLTIARHKSNRDYTRELQRRAHALPGLPDTFARNVSVFDRVWYGLHEVNPELVGTFSHNVEKIRGQA